MSETWQEMAARLAVEVTEKALPYGKTHSYIAKGERCREWAALESLMIAMTTSYEAVDVDYLSDTMKVLVRTDFIVKKGSDDVSI